MNDVEIQIDTIVEHSLKELEKKFPGSRFKLILRDFASCAHIDLLNTRLSTEIIKKLPVNLIGEEFGLDNASAQMAMLYANGKYGHYDKTISFLKDLKNVPIISILDEQVGNDFFAPWIRQKADIPQLSEKYRSRIGNKSFPTHEEFYALLEERHPQLFNHLDHDTTVAELESVLMAAIERRYRSGAIRYHIRNANGIKEMLAGVMDWHKTKGYAWWDEQVPSFLPEYKLRGYQFVTMTEIVPEGFDESQTGEVGGKTIKVIGDYAPLHEQFKFTQRDDLGEKILVMDKEQFARLRESYLHMLNTRRFIYPEAVEQVLDYEEKVTGRKLGHLRHDPHARANFYGAFYHHNVVLHESLLYLKKVLEGREELLQQTD